MRRVPYKDVLSKAASLWLGTSELSSEDAALLITYIDSRAKEAWESFFWPELTLTDYRTVVTEWNADSEYDVGMRVYWPAQKTYYVALVEMFDGTNEPPVSEDGVPSAKWTAAPLTEFPIFPYLDYVGE